MRSRSVHYLVYVFGPWANPQMDKRPWLQIKTISFKSVERFIYIHIYMHMQIYAYIYMHASLNIWTSQPHAHTLDSVRRNPYQVEAQLDYGPGSEIGVGWKIGVTWSRKRGFKLAATELGFLLTKSSFGVSLWLDISISWHGGKEL